VEGVDFIWSGSLCGPDCGIEPSRGGATVWDRPADGSQDDGFFPYRPDIAGSGRRTSSQIDYRRFRSLAQLAVILVAPRATALRISLGDNLDRRPRRTDPSFPGLSTEPAPRPANGIGGSKSAISSTLCLVAESIAEASGLTVRLVPVLGPRRVPGDRRCFFGRLNALGFRAIEASSSFPACE
jgi:hypothetical protein